MPHAAVCKACTFPGTCSQCMACGCVWFWPANERIADQQSNQQPLASVFEPATHSPTLATLCLPYKLSTLSAILSSNFGPPGSTFPPCIAQPGRHTRIQTPRIGCHLCLWRQQQQRRQQLRRQPQQQPRISHRRLLSQSARQRRQQWRRRRQQQAARRASACPRGGVQGRRRCRCRRRSGRRGQPRAGRGGGVDSCGDWQRRQQV